MTRGPFHEKHKNQLWYLTLRQFLRHKMAVFGMIMMAVIVFSVVFVIGILGVADAIISESGLSFLGLGIQPPTATWGNMLKNALDQIFTAPWTAIVPGFMIFLTVLSINYIGDGLRDAFDPRKILYPK